MKKVLITGAAGFLGSHLAARHLTAGDEVWGVDDFCSSSRSSRHIRLLTDHKRFRLVDADISVPIEAWWRKKTPRVDIVYNMACPASPPRYQSMPIKTMLTCVVGTSNALNIACADSAVFVQASTSEVYGDPTVSPQPETYRGNVNPYGPRSCYDEGKRAAEALCFDYMNSRGVDARVVRIFNTYGPHMDPYDGRVVTNFICQALKGEPLTVYGDGSQTRSFCYVDDLIDGLFAIAALGSNPGTPINLGNPNEFTVMELATIVSGLIGTSKVVSAPLPTDDPLQRKPDIGHAQRLLSWRPKVALRDGLGLTIEYIQSLSR